MYNINKIVGMLLLLIMLVSCKNKEGQTSRVEALPYYSEASFTPQWLTPNSIQVKAFHKIPSFSLTNQEGASITNKTFDDKIYVADFFFTTCPGICPKMTASMSVLQDEFIEDNEVLLLSHSVTPKSDSVSVLKKYAVEKGVISKKWHLVTGERSEIYDLGRNSYFVEEDLGATKTEEDFLHTENFVLIDENKHIRGIYNGLNKTAIQQLIADIQTLKKEP
ncbi:protein SCO1/2 [Gillisia sp. Hel_I_86]|uniref:SCO family protein n=1 Tax=Gillisia sp. Hel_I_86 TaxID=1249981 RepID=UPI00119C5A89|nr:SCO family protein [Gillisia sp. Hel_I_86]TVZ27951.1 protein SCO1/2 [Gillisia sp. Hel_I_86]